MDEMNGGRLACSCGGTYVVQCNGCGDYPGDVEVCPAGTLDALSGMLDFTAQYVGRQHLDEEGNAALTACEKAADAILKRAKED